MDLQVDRILGFRLVTANIDRLAQFYREVLGFTLQGSVHPIPAPELLQLGIVGGGKRQVLRIGEQIVALDQFETLGRPYPPDSNAASLWFQHLALVTFDIKAAYARLRNILPISEGGPQHLPPASGGAHAFKFRDPEGHPLELLEFPQGSVPKIWQNKIPDPGCIALGIDHSAISVSDPDASVAFYVSQGLKQGKKTLNVGVAQQHLDGLENVQVDVVPMRPNIATPHLELLGYRRPQARKKEWLRPNDVAATRIVWHGHHSALLTDLDGHFQQIET